MKKKFEILVFGLGWIAVIAQFFLMMQNRQADIPETIIRFFSFFTILTNILVALYFTMKVFNSKSALSKILMSSGSLTAITTFILIVGLVYQFILRKIWHPTGLQMIVDELLHSLIPFFMLGYWYFNFKKENLHWKSIFYWLIYPAIYLLIIIIRGHFSHYYPYSFLNIDQIGIEKVLVNILFILLLCIILIVTLTSLGKYIINVKTKKL